MEQDGDKRKHDNANNISEDVHKRRKLNEVKPSGFERELAKLGIAENPTSKWRRPPLPVIDEANDNILFQQLDIDHYIGMTVEDLNLYCHSVPLINA